MWTQPTRRGRCLPRRRTSPISYISDTSKSKQLASARRLAKERKGTRWTTRWAEQHPSAASASSRQCSTACWWPPLWGSSSPDRPYGATRAGGCACGPTSHRLNACSHLMSCNYTLAVRRIGPSTLRSWVTCTMSVQIHEFTVPEAATASSPGEMPVARTLRDASTPKSSSHTTFGGSATRTCRMCSSGRSSSTSTIPTSRSVASAFPPLIRTALHRDRASRPRLDRVARWYEAVIHTHHCSTIERHSP